MSTAVAKFQQSRHREHDVNGSGMMVRQPDVAVVQYPHITDSKPAYGHRARNRTRAHVCAEAYTRFRSPSGHRQRNETLTKYVLYDRCGDIPDVVAPQKIAQRSAWNREEAECGHR